MLELFEYLNSSLIHDLSINWVDLYTPEPHIIGAGLLEDQVKTMWWRLRTGAGRCAVFPAHALGHIASLQRVRLKCSKSLSYEHPSNLFAQDLARLHYPISHCNISYANDEDTGMGAVNITMERSNEHPQPHHEPETGLGAVGFLFNLLTKLNMKANAPILTPESWP